MKKSGSERTMPSRSSASSEASAAKSREDASEGWSPASDDERTREGGEKGIEGMWRLPCLDEEVDEEGEGAERRGWTAFDFLEKDPPPVEEAAGESPQAKEEPGVLLPVVEVLVAEVLVVMEEKETRED